MKKYIFLSICFITLSAGCRSQTSSYAPKEVIGADGREVVENNPYRETVGLFTTPKGPCTAFVSDQNEITTAAHCFNPKTDINAYLFSANDGQLETQVTELVRKNGDTVILRTKELLPKTLNLSFANADRPGTLVSFDPEKQNLTLQNQCQVRPGEIDGSYLHDCDSTPGSSGSPLLQDGTVVGVHIGFAKKLGWNIALDPNHQQLHDASSLKQLIDFFPEGRCSTNCYKHCRRKVLGRWVANPPCEAACQLERAVACNPETKQILVCGVAIAVREGVQAACTSSPEHIKTACSAGAATTSGSSCGLAIATAAAACSITEESVKFAARSCGAN